MPQQPDLAHGVVIAGLSRNPVVVWHWIPGQARDDSLEVRDDKTKGRRTFAESPIASPSACASLRIGIAEISMTVIVAVIDVRKVRMAVLHFAVPVRVLMLLGQMQIQASRHQHAGAPEPG